MATDKKDNMFGSYGEAAAQREQEQQKIEAEVTGQSAAKKPRAGRPRKRPNATSITLIVSAEDKKKMQDYAYNHAMTSSDLLHRWISELPDD